MNHNVHCTLYTKNKLCLSTSVRHMIYKIYDLEFFFVKLEKSDGIIKTGIRDELV